MGDFDDREKKREKGLGSEEKRGGRRGDKIWEKANVVT